MCAIWFKLPIIFPGNQLINGLRRVENESVISVKIIYDWMCAVHPYQIIEIAKCEVYIKKTLEKLYIYIIKVVRGSVAEYINSTQFNVTYI